MQSLSHIGIIALNTFRESVRDKILYNIVFLAIGLAFFSILLGEWSVFDRAHVIKSTTLSIMSLSGLLISVFVGISLVQKEIQGRTVLTLLSKPISRVSFIVGKYLGLLAVVAVHISLLTLVYYGILWLTNSHPTLALLQAVYLVFWEMAIVVAVALLFSSFSTPVLSALFTLGVYVAGHLSDQLLEQVRFVRRMGEVEGVQSLIMEKTAVVVHAVFPGLYRFSVSGYVVHGVPLPDHYLLWNTLYALGYIGIFLAIASWWFSRRGFPMRNQYMAKVLFSNQLVSEAQIQEYWGKITPEKDLGLVLCEAGILSREMYDRVLDYVKVLEARASSEKEKAAPAKAAASPNPKKEPPPEKSPAPAASAAKAAPQSASSTFSRKSPAEKKAGSPSASPSVPPAAASPASVSAEAATVSSAASEPASNSAPKAEVSSGFSVQGNNPFGEVSSSDVQVEPVAGLESTSMVAEPLPVSEVSESPAAAESVPEAEQILPDRFAVLTGEGQVTVPSAVTPETSLSEILAFARKYNATDVYLQPGFQIVMRQAGTQHYVSDAAVEDSHLNAWLAEATLGFADGYAPVPGVDFNKTLALSGAGRARITVIWEKSAPSFAIRLIPQDAIALDQLYLPPFCKDFLSLRSGLVLIAGPSGSGRSTMMTSFGETIAASRPVYLQTIEKPVERLLKNSQGIVVQKEVGLHVLSGSEGLREAISDGADVILFDHIESVEEFWLLLRASNAGALVFAVASGNTILGMMTRLLDSAASDRRQALALAVADQLKGVIVQHLIPVVQGQGQILAVEAMKVTSTIANLIRKGELPQIPLAVSAAKNQGQTLDDSLQGLVESGYIEGAEAWKRAQDPRRFVSYRPDRKTKGV